ncbi:MAG: type II secretion system GspH family protein, partial [Pirellulales bacterium]|nr:type II secretion system GspH family protein [Pirellulales bacterium]
MHTVTRDLTASGASPGALPLLRKASRARKTGFTLVELLVVLMIIGMLTAMVSFAMFRSMQAAREAKTQALISKLHNVLVRHWDTFETG